MLNKFFFLFFLNITQSFDCYAHLPFEKMLELRIEQMNKLFGPQVISVSIKSRGQSFKEIEKNLAKDLFNTYFDYYHKKIIQTPSVLVLAYKNGLLSHYLDQEFISLKMPKELEFSKQLKQSFKKDMLSQNNKIIEKWLKNSSFHLIAHELSRSILIKYNLGELTKMDPEKLKKELIVNLDLL